MNRRSRQQRDLTSDRASNNVYSSKQFGSLKKLPKGLLYKAEVFFKIVVDRGNSNSDRWTKRLILWILSPTPSFLSQAALFAGSVGLPIDRIQDME